MKGWQFRPFPPPPPLHIGNEFPSCASDSSHPPTIASSIFLGLNAAGFLLPPPLRILASTTSGKLDRVILPTPLPLPSYTQQYHTKKTFSPSRPKVFFAPLRGLSDIIKMLHEVMTHKLFFSRGGEPSRILGIEGHIRFPLPFCGRSENKSGWGRRMGFKPSSPLFWRNLSPSSSNRAVRPFLSLFPLPSLTSPAWMESLRERGGEKEEVGVDEILWESVARATRRELREPRGGKRVFSWFVRILLYPHLCFVEATST